MAASELLIMPSYLESLSMVALEAWAMGKPVLANAKCDVLQGQCLRSNAGLFYENYAEFAETLRAIDTTPSLQAALGRNGRLFFDRHYAWPVIEKKYVDMLEQLSKESSPRLMEPLPGWFAAGARSQPPADEVVKKLPAGPYRELEGLSSQPAAIGRQPSTAAQLRRVHVRSQEPRLAQSSDGSSRGARRITRPKPRPRASDPTVRNSSRANAGAPPPAGGRAAAPKPKAPTIRRGAISDAAGRIARPSAGRLPEAARAAMGEMARTTQMRRRSIRCSRPLATVMPSVTRCWASSACCATPDTNRRSSFRPPTRGSNT